jgi:hypothetical protein
MAAARRTAAALSAAALVAAVLAQGSAGAPRADMAFRTIEKSSGTSSRIADQRTLAIRSAAKWRQAWRQLHKTPKKLPKVDFAKHVLILVTQGEKPSSGYGIAIERIVLAGGELTVHVVETEPDPAAGCSYLQVITRPYHVVRLRKTDRPVAPVTRRTAPAGC